MGYALVTGGTQGIGLAIAQALREGGHQVIVTGSKAVGIAKVLDGCKYWSCDFSKVEEVNEFVKKIEDWNISVLVNNAGINKVRPFTEYPFEDFLLLQQVNVFAPFLLCKAVIPVMRKVGFGRIVNITSVFGEVSKEGRSAYSASKFSLFGMSRGLALEVAKDNILVNCVAPGFVDTILTRKILGESGIKDVISHIPLGRLAKPEEIAEYVKFLVSSSNTYITGQNLIVDGGFTSA